MPSDIIYCRPWQGCRPSVMQRESCLLFQHGMEGLAFPNLLAGSLKSVLRSQPPHVNLILSQIPIYPKQVQLEQRQVWHCGRGWCTDALMPPCPRPSKWWWSWPVKSEHPPGSLPSLWQGMVSTSCTSRPSGMCLRFELTPARLASHCMPMWPSFQRQPCSQLPLHPSQCHQRHHYSAPHWSVPECGCWTPAPTSEWREVPSLKHKCWGQCIIVLD